MELPYVGELPRGSTRCKVCREPIQADARKCVHCQSDQGWRSRLGVSVTMMSLVVALVSVVTAAAPAFLALITPKNSKLSFSVQGSTQDNIFVLVSNQGVRPGSVRAGNLTFAGDDPNSRVPLVLHIEGLAPNEPKLIDANDTEIIRFKSPANPPSQGAITACRLELYGADFLGVAVKNDFDVDCNRVRLFISNHRKAL